ncbi:MAG: Mth938-like domain-containing protein, partial [Sedimentisphaerales bacterium]|nr:Mth938-like domain-containing protein [Sedimentisphaerales bacterium]
MHIDSYQFGKIVIDGTAYNSDCLIIGGSVRPNWWRKQGHLLTPEDLEIVIEARPKILVVGCGALGMMKVSECIGQLLQEHGIELFKAKTSKAVEKFNELSSKGENVAAAFHLTC